VGGGRYCSGVIRSGGSRKKKKVTSPCKLRKVTREPKRLTWGLDPQGGSGERTRNAVVLINHLIRQDEKKGDYGAGVTGTKSINKTRGVFNTKSVKGERVNRQGRRENKRRKRTGRGEGLPFITMAQEKLRRRTDPALRSLEKGQLDQQKSGGKKKEKHSRDFTPVLPP